MTKRDLSPEDLEAIAAFIDGRLSPEEREAFVQRLDSEKPLYEVFVETVRYREEESGEADVVLHPAWRRPRAATAALAAVLALALATPVLIMSRSGPSYGESLLADDRLGDRLVGDWFEQDWSQTRGILPATDEGDTAFRVGVRSLDLEVALRADRSDDAGTLTLRLDRLLKGIELSAALRTAYSDLHEMIEQEGASPAVLSRAVETETLTGQYLGDLEPAYRLGRWTEAGRLAAQSRNGGFLRSRAFRRDLRELRELDWTAEASSRLERLDELLARPKTDLEFEALEEAFVAVIKES